MNEIDDIKSKIGRSNYPLTSHEVNDDQEAELEQLKQIKPSCAHQFIHFLRIAEGINVKCALCGEERELYPGEPVKIVYTADEKKK